MIFRTELNKIRKWFRIDTLVFNLDRRLFHESAFTQRIHRGGTRVDRESVGHGAISNLVLPPKNPEVYVTPSVSSMND